MIYNSQIRNKIIKTLAKYKTLRAKEIYRILRLKVSYQAVFKMIKSMVDENILEQKKLEYSLNEKFIEETIEFVEELKLDEKEKYGSVCEKVKDKKETVTLKFHKQIELIKYIFGFLDYCSTIEPNDYCLFHISSLYGIFSLPKEIAKNIEHLSKNTKVYMIARQDTKWNEVVCDFFQKLGIHIKTGVNFGGKDTIIYKNVVLRIVCNEKDSEELFDMARRIYQESNINVTDFLYNLYDKEIEFTLEIFCDPKFASQMKDRFLDEF